MKLCIALVLAFVAFSSQSKAQTLQRQGIGSAGNLILADGILVQQTIGQPYATVGYRDDAITFLPGFQQSSNLKTEFVHSELRVKVDVYPNPAASGFSVESAAAIRNALVQVVDMHGKVMLNEKVDELKSYAVNCEAWPSGLYLITVSDRQNRKHATKLIINK